MKKILTEFRQRLFEHKQSTITGILIIFFLYLLHNKVITFQEWIEANAAIVAVVALLFKKGDVSK